MTIIIHLFLVSWKKYLNYGQEVCNPMDGNSDTLKTFDKIPACDDNWNYLYFVFIGNMHAPCHHINTF